MARFIQHLREQPHDCAYLPDEQASLEILVLQEVSPSELGLLLTSGWRRFGQTYFRPACRSCAECVPLRVPVATFRASRSQRRAERLAARLDRIVGAPQVDDERLALYDRWHAHREHHRGWDANPMDERRYVEDFASEHPSVREVAFRDPAREGRLVGLGIVDQVPDALSAVYFFWDPEMAPPSLGTAHIVRLIDDAAAIGLDHVYLGYRVSACASLAYKSRFRPHEVLENDADNVAGPVWRVPPDEGVR